ncbi:MAG: hypothetical protein JWM76_4929, partial [Pseudonocardiales bacterium]|nr:hypothetical protein [Pseudonocardiales bacterium]
MADALIVSGEPFRVVVEEGKIYEFARAIKSSTPEHFRSPDPISPVTFLTSAVLWMEPENSAWFGITRNFANILHGEQEFVFHSAPPVAGTELNVVQYFGTVVEKAGRRGGRMTLTEVITKFWTDSPDHPVVVGKAVSIETHPLIETHPPTAHPPTAHPPAAQAPAKPSGDSPSAPPVATAGSELDVALDPFVVRAVTFTDFVKYLCESVYFNAIHHD